MKITKSKLNFTGIGKPIELLLTSDPIDVALIDYEIYIYAPEYSYQKGTPKSAYSFMVLDTNTTVPDSVLLDYKYLNKVIIDSKYDYDDDKLDLKPLTLFIFWKRDLKHEEDKDKETLFKDLLLNFDRHIFEEEPRVTETVC